MPGLARGICMHLCQLLLGTPPRPRPDEVLARASQHVGRARATGCMRSKVTMQTKNGTANFMWGVDALGTESASPYPSEPVSPIAHPPLHVAKHVA